MTMPSFSPRVTTIIPTMAARTRAPALRRAIDSIRRSSREPVAIIVVVNGDRHDTELCDWLRMQPDVRFEYVEKPSAPNAVLRGRELVETTYFSTLDDDDEYLPNATDIKLAALEASPDADLVVTNGLRHCEGRDETFYENFGRVSRAPLASLFDSNWLHNCNTLFRSATVGREYFADYHPFVEWTWLAFRLAMAGRSVHALDVPTFRYHDTPGSLSKSKAYGETILALYRRMLEAGPPPEVERLIRRRMSATWHSDSVRALGRGQWLRALECHLRSLLMPGGSRYLSYSRHLVPGWPRSR